MKQQTIYKLLFAIALIVFVSCNDTYDSLGVTIQPEGDRITVGADTLLLTARTVNVDSVFSKTKYPVLGEYSDPVFGTIRSDYAGEFFYPEDYSFIDGAEIDSVLLTVSYTSMLGDSLAPMQLAVYKIIDRLPEGSYYTNFDPTVMADMSKPLGTKVFTGRNNTYRTEYYTSGTSTQEIKIYEIHAELPKSVGQAFLDEYNKPDHGALKNSDSFNDFFPGLYVTTDFGNSTILNVNLTSLRVLYKYLDKGGSSQKTDTIRSSEWRLNITPEVTQINRIESKDTQLLGDDSNGTYVKSPAGVNTEISIPLSNLSSTLSGSTAINQAKFIVRAKPDVFDDNMVKLTPPSSLLLLNKDSVTTFFEERQLPDHVTSFIANFDQSTYSYDFGNVSKLINYYKTLNQNDSSKPLDQTYVLIPVDVTSVTNSSYYGSSEEITDVYNQMKPSGVMLDNKTGNLRLDIIYSSF